MARKRVSLAMDENTGRRFMLAYRFLNVHSHELLAVALDSIGIPPLFEKEAIRDKAWHSIRKHLDMIEKSGIDEDMDNYFKRTVANDNE